MEHVDIPCQALYLMAFWYTSVTYLAIDRGGYRHVIERVVHRHPDFTAKFVAQFQDTFSVNINAMKS